MLRLTDQEYQNPRGYPLILGKGYKFPRECTEALCPRGDSLVPTASLYILLRLNWYTRRLAKALLRKYPWIMMSRKYIGNSLNSDHCLNQDSRNAWIWLHEWDGIETTSLHGNLCKSFSSVLIDLIDTHPQELDTLFSLDLYPAAWSQVRERIKNSKSKSIDVGRAFSRALLRWEPDALPAYKNKALRMPPLEMDSYVVDRIWSKVKELDKRTNKKGDLKQTLYTYEGTKTVRLKKLSSSAPSFEVEPSESSRIRLRLETNILNANKAKKHSSRMDRRTTAAFYAIKDLVATLQSRQAKSQTTYGENKHLAVWAQGVVREWIISVDECQQGMSQRNSYWKQAATWVYVFSTTYSGFCKVGITHSISQRIRSPDCAGIYAKEIFKVRLPTRILALQVESVVLQRTFHLADCPPQLKDVAGWTEVRRMDANTLVEIVKEISMAALNWEQPFN